MYASLTLLRNRLIAWRSSLLVLAVVILSAGLVSCGGDTGEETVQIPSTPTSEPTVEMPAPTATTAPTVVVPPTATVVPPTATAVPAEAETPYWAKPILPGMAMKQYPPVNDRTDYELRNTQEWLNGEPTTIAEIRDSGRVVLVDFWTYT